MSSSVETPLDAGAHRGRSAILLVEDDQDLSELIEAELRAAGSDVHAVRDGLEALEALAISRFHLILLDLMLPRMSGTEVCSEIRAQSNIPVLIMSAKSRLSDVLWGLQLGADDYLIKPFDLRELVARARVLLRRGHRPGGWILRRGFRHGDVTVDFRQRVAVIRGTKVKLSPTEARLLACLSATPGAVVGREELLARVWGWDNVTEKRYLKLYISYLRKKLELDPRQPDFLICERGVGYHLNLNASEAHGSAEDAEAASLISV